jgi:PAS domain S-box-containing protein
MSNISKDRTVPIKAEHTRSMLLEVDSAGKVIDISYLGNYLLGWNKAEVLGRQFSEAFSHASVAGHRESLEKVLESAGQTVQVSFSSREGHIHTYHIRVEPAELEGNHRLVISTMDSQSPDWVLKDKLISQMLLRSHMAESLEDLIRGSSLMLKDYTGADAVGIRLKRGRDFPYFEISGFSEEFAVNEDSICRHECTDDGLGAHECLCGCVLDQRMVDDLNTFTSFGSFFTNDAQQLVKQAVNVQNQIALRGKCLVDGFLSVALIPMRLRGTIHGLIQLNSFDTNAFSEKLIESVQSIADHLVIAIDNFVQREELKTVNEKLLAGNERLRNINSELSMFAAEVTHDLRSPLNQVKQYIHLLESELDNGLTDNGELYMERIKDVVPRMQEMITSFITLTRISDTKPASFEVNLSQVVKRALKDAQQEFPEVNIDAQIEEDLKVQADPGLIQIAINNLVNNAVKYSSKETIARISFGRTQSKEKNEFYISDNGIGMNVKEMDKLFKPFKRLSNVEGYHGTGIGLSSVKRAIERMGGSIRCESKIGEGTTFYFTV